jgi:hypothetical protein
VYPNPAAAVLHIFANENTALLLASSSGKVVWTGKIAGSTTINVSQLPTGVYFLSTPNRQGEQKIVVFH